MLGGSVFIKNFREDKWYLNEWYLDEGRKLVTWILEKRVRGNSECKDLR